LLFSEDLKAFLTARGYSNIFRDTMPDEPHECIGLFVWDNPRPGVNVGASWRYVQIQARRLDPDAACATVAEILELLDSGQGGTKIQLAEGRVCTIRPRRGPKKLGGVDASGRTVYYIELAFWGLNKA